MENGSKLSASGQVLIPDQDEPFIVVERIVTAAEAVQIAITELHMQVEFALNGKPYIPAVANALMLEKRIAIEGYPHYSKTMITVAQAEEMERAKKVLFGGTSEHAAA